MTFLVLYQPYLTLHSTAHTQVLLKPRKSMPAMLLASLQLPIPTGLMSWEM